MAFPREAARLHDELAHTSCTLAHLRNRKIVPLVCAHGLLDAVPILREKLCRILKLIGHFDVVARADFAPHRNCRGPIGHGEAFVSPFIAQDTGDEPIVLAGVVAVHAVVTRHDGPRFGLLDGAFEATQVDFAKGPLGNDVPLRFTRRLAAIAGKIGEIAKAEQEGKGATKKVADFWWDYPTNYAQDKSDEIEKCFHAHAAKLYVETIWDEIKEPTSAQTNDSADAVPNVEYKFTYNLDKDGTAIITGVDPNPVGTVVIPDKIDGHLVTALQGWPSPSPFEHCDRVTKIVLPAKIKIYDNGVFIRCKSLSSIEVSEANKGLASHDGVLYSKDFSTLLVYPPARESVMLSPKTKKFARNALRCCALKTAKIPEGIEHIDSLNLYECPDLESIEFPKSLKLLGDHVAGWGDKKLKKIVFNGDAPQIVEWGTRVITQGNSGVFSGTPENLVIEVRKGTKGWKSPDSTELPERWPMNHNDSRPIRYIE